jgi:hypothetical protein
MKKFLPIEATRMTRSTTQTIALEDCTHDFGGDLGSDIHKEQVPERWNVIYLNGQTFA